MKRAKEKQRPTKSSAKGNKLPKIDERTITLTFSVHSVNQLLAHLSRLPFGDVAEMYLEIQHHATAQLEELQGNVNGGAVAVKQPERIPHSP